VLRPPLVVLAAPAPGQYRSLAPVDRACRHRVIVSSEPTEEVALL
jgi:hypothetical protein